LLLEVALNGTRSISDHPAIPIAPAQHAAEAQDSVAAGAGAIHVHVRDASGNETLAASEVADTVTAIRDACPGIPVGISTGAWIVPDLRERLRIIRSWKVLPDFASVNFHEAGAVEVLQLLLDRGIGVEAGIWNAPAAVALVESGFADRCVRVLLEPAEASCRARTNLLQMEAVLDGVTPHRLLHGLGPSAWEFIDLAAKRRYDTRVGFEDTLRLPDGSPAANNAQLVAAALERISRSRMPIAIETGRAAPTSR
jgi:uncharacterized protein (DUF849 family)